MGRLILIIWLAVGVPFSIWMFDEIWRGKHEWSDLPVCVLYGLSGVALWPLYAFAWTCLRAANLIAERT